MSFVWQCYAFICKVERCKDYKVVVNPQAIRVQKNKTFFLCFLLPCWKCCACSADNGLVQAAGFQPVARARIYESYYGEGTSYEY